MPVQAQDRGGQESPGFGVVYGFWECWFPGGGIAPGWSSAGCPGRNTGAVARGRGNRTIRVIHYKYD